MRSRRLLGDPARAPQPVHGRAVPEQPDSDVALQPRRGEDRQRVAAAAEPGRHRQPAHAAVRAAVGRRRSSVARPRRSQLQRQTPDVRAVLGLAGLDARRAPRRQHPQQRVRPDVAEHRCVGQRHLHPAPEPAEQPGRDVQPDEQPQLPDLPARLLDARHQRLQRQDAAVVLRRRRLLRHQQRRHEYVPPQRNPVRGHRALDEGPARSGDRHRLQLRPGRHRQQLPRQRTVQLFERGRRSPATR